LRSELQKENDFFFEGWGAVFKNCSPFFWLFCLRCCLPACLQQSIACLQLPASCFLP
jgi:hypothetical protein